MTATSTTPTWDPHVLPDQTGRTVVVTGANAGIGYFVAEQLAGAGAHVVVASRDAVKAGRARAAIDARHPGATTSFLPLDLASLASVRAAGELLADLDRVDALILNAAAMRISRPGEATADGFDPVMGTGHLGNVALVAHALPVLARTPGSRVVGTTSGLVRRFHPPVEDLARTSRPLRSTRALAVGRRYVQSKAAHEAFLRELDRRLRAAGSPVSALLSHPGMAVGSRTPVRDGVVDHPPGERRHEPLWGLVGASKETAAWSAVRAAADPDARGGQYWGPSGRIGGPPVLGRPHPRFGDPAVGARVWRETETLLGLRVPVG